MELENKDDVKSQSDEGCSEEESISFSDASAIQRVYCNDYLMSKILSYVNNVKDRIQVESCSRWLNHISLRTPYYAYGESNTRLDIQFANLKPLATLSIAGNEVTFQVLTMAGRSGIEPMPTAQPATALKIIEEFLLRFQSQTRRLMIGGTTDFERRVGFIPEHILVVTRDLCDLLDRFQRVDSLSLRDCCLNSETVEYWRHSNSPLMKRTKSLCLHGIYLDCVPDCTTFLEMISAKTHRLCLSECSETVILNICDWLRRVKAHLASIFVAIDHRTFNDKNLADRAFMELPTLADELHVCVICSQCIVSPGYRRLASIISDLPYQSKISVLEVDLGVVKRGAVNAYDRFFRGFRHMRNLRVLRLRGYPWRYSGLWWSFVDSMHELVQLRELSLNRLLENAISTDLRLLCALLPTGLRTLSLYGANSLTDDCLETVAKMRLLGENSQPAVDNCSAIFQRCPNLVTIYLEELGSVTSSGIQKLLLECHHLRELAVCSCAAAPHTIYETLLYCNMPSELDALIISNHKHPLNIELSNLLLRLFFHFKVFDDTSNGNPSYEYHMWRSHAAYRHLLAAADFADCPSCGVDVTLVETDDLDLDIEI